MKKTEIIPKMFEDWKAEMREVFKNDKDSMNLIAMGLKVIDDPTKTDLHGSWNKQLLEFMENELANKKKLTCPNCGNLMEVYYKVYCFHCDKPKIEKYKGNYLMAVKWLKYNEPEFNGHYVWDYLCNHDILRGNDTYISLLDDCQTDAKYNQNIRLFKKHFPIEDILWFVSW